MREQDDEVGRLREARKQKRTRPGQSGNGGLPESVSLSDFYAYMPMHNYIYSPCGEVWPAASVNARIAPIPLVDRNGAPLVNKKGEQIMQPANAWLDKNRPVEQMTWAPGLPMIIRDRLISSGGWIERRGVSCYNLYKPPVIELGDPDEAEPWIEHVHRLYSKADAHHSIRWLAHRVQHPQEKINHALFLGGLQGIGKDTMLEPVKYAVGPWNFADVSPHCMLETFNPHVRSVILRINEARDLGDVNRFSFYDHMKAYTAAPPDVLRVNEKHLRHYSVPNCCGVTITSNHKANGIFLPADDRRHYVAWSDAQKEDFTDNYWKALWGWYESGGYGHVAAYLASLDLSDFNPKAPPPKTAAFWDIVDANRAPEDAELADVLDELGNPDATTLAQVLGKATGAFYDWLYDRKNRRQMPFRFEQCGYVPVRNDAAKDGLWKVGGRRQVVYANASLSVRERMTAAAKLA